MKTSWLRASAAASLLIGILASDEGSSSPTNIRRRRLANLDLQLFENAACRASNGSKGSESAGEIERHAMMPGKKCARECFNLGSACHAYQYTPRNRACEIWRVPVDEDDLEHEYGSSCYIKEDDGDAPGLTSHDNAAFGFETHEDAGCRTADGSKGSQNSGDFVRYMKTDAVVCRMTCMSMGRTCFGYEISSTGHCEAWKVPISKYELEHADGSRCYVKEGYDVPAPTPPPESPMPTEYPSKHHSTEYPTNNPTVRPNSVAREDVYESFRNKDCRTSVGGKGSRQTGEFDRYANTSREDCERRCRALGSECFGYEHSSRGRCEAWKVPIDGSMLRDAFGLDCHVRDTGGPRSPGTRIPTARPTAPRPTEPTPPPTTPFPTEYPTLYPTLSSLFPTPNPGEFEPFRNRGCRTAQGDKGSRNTGEFGLLQRVFRETCERECLDYGYGCYGYEYSSRGRCELWRVPIGQYVLAYEEGVDCYFRNNGGEDI